MPSRRGSKDQESVPAEDAAAERTVEGMIISLENAPTVSDAREKDEEWVIVPLGRGVSIKVRKGAEDKARRIGETKGRARAQ